MNKPLEINGQTLTLDDVVDVAYTERKVVLSTEAKQRVQHARDVLEDLIDSGEVIYGVNTGFGKFAEIAIPKEDLRTLQKNLVLSHAAGVGDPLPDDVVRAAILLKANTMASGHSGVRPVVIDTLLAMLNAGIHPVVPSKGSVGASGDLAPLAHLTLVALGQGEARVNGVVKDGGKALTEAGMMPLELAAKEGLALLNGTQVMTASGILTLNRSDRLFKNADVIGAMSVEALSGSASPFDSRIHDVRGQEGQKGVAANLIRLLEGSDILRERPMHRVQEAYSLRCMPQVHGAGRDALVYVRSVLEKEINAATDNPLVFADERDVLSGGNFHGEPLALALDTLGTALASLGAISERRITHLMDPSTSDLPGFLAERQGLDSGYMIAQITAASLTSQNKVLAHPASVDSVPTSANQEDYVSMGMTSALKAMEIAENTEHILAIELLCASRGIDIRTPLKPSPPLTEVYQGLRKIVPPMEEDRYLAPDIERAVDFIRSGGLLASVPSQLEII